MTPPLSAVLHHLRRKAAGEAGPADTELLERFTATRDEAAFELLVWRHGPMVLATCRRALSDAHAAEDAFQATFLALARRAAAVRRGASVAAWLHRVAARAAQAVGRRAGRERPLDGVAPAGRELEPSAAAGLHELRRALDEAVDRLPARYREPLILTCLAGRSHAEVARELGCAVRTVESRVGRARQRLRAALTRRGFAPSAGLAVLAPADTGVTAPLVAAAVRAAARGSVPGAVETLTQGVLHAMLLSKLKVAGTVVLIAGAVGLGVGGWAVGQSPADVPAKAVVADPARPKADRRERVQMLLRELGAALEDPDLSAETADRLRDLLKSADERQVRREERDRVLAEQLWIVRWAVVRMKEATAADARRQGIVNDFESEVVRLAARLRADQEVKDGRGTVLRIDGELATISVGADAGVNVGNKLHVVRVQPAPEYLGRIEILATTPQRSVGRLSGPKQTSIRVGDEVAISLAPVQAP